MPEPMDLNALKNLYGEPVIAYKSRRTIDEDTEATSTTVQHFDISDRPRGVAGRFSSMLQENGLGSLDKQASDNYAEDDTDVPAAAKALPPRSNIGQIYRVIFKPMIAVREYPGIGAAMIRGLKFGVKVKCFEWDQSRMWRRVRVNRLVEARDAGQRVQHVEESDGWVLIHSSEFGLLLETMDGEEEDERDICIMKKFERLLDSPSEAQTAEEVHVIAQTSAPENTEIVSPKEQPEDTAGGAAIARGVPKFAEIVLSQTELDRILNSVEDRSTIGEPQLSRAVRTGSLKAVDCLLRRFADVNGCDRFGETALFEAVSANHVDIVGHLLLCHADTNLRHNFHDRNVRLDLGDDGNDHFFRMVSSASPIMQALLARWRQEPTDSEQLIQALLCLADADRTRMLKLWDMTLPERTQKSALETINQHVQKLKSQEAEKAKAQEAGTKQAFLVKAAPSAPALEDLELDENGVPRRQEMPVHYRVMFKKMVVRSLPHPEADVISIFYSGDIVGMYEWDINRAWRRVRVETEAEDRADVEMDGWMMLHSEKHGPLLVEVFEDDDDTVG